MLGLPTEQKMTRTAPALIAMGPYQARWMQSDYESHAREGYSGNPYVFAAIRQIATAFAGIPWCIYKDESKRTKYDKHPLGDLLNKRPNPMMSGPQFWENWVGYLYLDGNSYIERVPDGQPTEIYALRPDRMRVIPGNTQQLVAGYVYRVGGVEQPFPFEVINHTKFFHPLNDWYGMSPIQAGTKAIDQDNQSKAWNVSLLQNGAAPTGALVSPATVDDIQYQRLREMIEERYAGFLNAGRPIIVEGGLQWMEMGMSPKDMHWLEGQKLSAREIAMVFNIAPELIGDPESKTYSNYGEARKALYEETVLPLMDLAKQEINRWLGPLFDGVIVDYDRTEIEALHENQDAVYARNNAAFVSGWITVADARQAAGLSADPTAGPYYRWQLPLNAPFDPTQGAQTPLPPTVVTGGSLPFPELPPDHPLNQGPPSLLPGDNPSLLPGGMPPKPDASNPDGQGSASVVQSAMTVWLGGRQRTARKEASVYHKDIARLRGVWSKKAQLATGEPLKPLRNALASARSGRSDPADLPNLLPTLLKGQRDSLLANLMDTASTAAGAFGAWSLDALTTRIGVPAFDPRDADYAAHLNSGIQSYVNAWLPNYVDRIVLAYTKAVKRAEAKSMAFAPMRRAIYELKSAGDDYGDDSSDMDPQDDTNVPLDVALGAMLDEFGLTVADYITTTVSNLGPLISAGAFSNAESIELQKQWSAVGDGRTRPSHDDANGQTQDLADPFEVGDSELMFPMDTSLGASDEEVLGCRCVVLFNAA